MSILLALGALACHQAAAPEPNTQQNFPTSEAVVAVGDTVWFGNTGIGVAFREVRQDSRCPTDVVCAWSGNAEVVLDVISKSMPPRNVVLNSTVGDKDVVYSGYLVQLTALDPSPLSTDTHRAYRAHLSLRYLPD